MTRREFSAQALAMGAFAATRRLPGVEALAGGGGYAVAVLGDTHYDTEPEGVYHSDWDPNEYHAALHHGEFLRNGEMWRERCPRLVAASAALAAARPVAFVLQLGDLVQGDCGNPATHQKMLGDALARLRKGYGAGTPFLTVLGNHDVRGTGARAAYLDFARDFMGREVAALAGPGWGAAEYPVFSFVYRNDLWVFCDFETDNLDAVCGALEAHPEARHVFLVTHGPFTAHCPAGWFDWRLGGRETCDGSRPRLYETLSRRRAVVLAGHTHTTNFYRHENRFGGWGEAIVNSVWAREELATAAPVHASPDDYRAGDPENARWREAVALFRPGLKEYFYNRGAGHYRLNVADAGVSLDYYPGDAAAPARRFVLKG